MRTARCIAAMLTIAAGAAVAHAMGFSAWAPAVDAEQAAGTSSQLNTAASDGCPIESPDGLRLYLASNRPRFEGDTRTDLDIWVARRDGPDEPWGAPENPGAPVNSSVDDFCPTPVRGGGLFFVSRRDSAGACGGADIYFARSNPKHGWADPAHLACGSAGGPNTPLDEMGPSYVTAGGPTLYYSSGPDIYASDRNSVSRFGPGQPVAELNSVAADIQPNVRRDGREVVFASNRLDSTAFGGQDIWVATRNDVLDPWSPPVNLGSVVNTAANETRPSLSWRGTTLYFGRAPAPVGPGDIFTTTREKAGD